MSLINPFDLTLLMQPFPRKIDCCSLKFSQNTHIFERKWDTKVIFAAYFIVVKWSISVQRHVWFYIPRLLLLLPVGDFGVHLDASEYVRPTNSNVFDRLYVGINRMPTVSTPRSCRKCFVINLGGRHKLQVQHVPLAHYRRNDHLDILQFSQGPFFHSIKINTTPNLQSCHQMFELLHYSSRIPFAGTSINTS